MRENLYFFYGIQVRFEQLINKLVSSSCWFRQNLLIFLIIMAVSHLMKLIKLMYSLITYPHLIPSYYQVSWIWVGQGSTGLLYSLSHILFSGGIYLFSFSHPFWMREIETLFSPSNLLLFWETDWLKCCCFHFSNITNLPVLIPNLSHRTQCSFCPNSLNWLLILSSEHS